MFYTCVRAQSRFVAGQRRRNFVSTVLLTRNWENHTVNDLKQEARKRGLTQSGNKATLITRLVQDDDMKARAHVAPSSPAATPVRHASTAEVPGVPSNPPEPIPPALKGFASIRLPSLSEPEPEPLVQIPFVPDLWDSSRIKAASAPKKLVEVENLIPKMIAVAGRATHHGDGPVHNLYTEPYRGDDVEPTKPETALSSFFADVAEDLNIPTTLKVGGTTPQHPGAVYDVPEATHTSGGKGVSHSRTFDREERRGVYLLLGLIAGSWIAAGQLNGESKFSTKVKETAEHVVEKAKH